MSTRMDNCLKSSKPSRCRTNHPGVRGFSQPLFSRFQAACKPTVVLSSRCDLITKALASLLSGFIEVLSTLTTRTASDKMADIIEGSRVYFDNEGPIYVCIAHTDGNFYFQDESGKRKVCFADNIVQVS